MELVIGILVVVAAGYGVLRFLRFRKKEQVASQARAEKREKAERADAAAMRKCLDQRWKGTGEGGEVGNGERGRPRVISV